MVDVRRTRGPYRPAKIAVAVFGTSPRPLWRLGRRPPCQTRACGVLERAGRGTDGTPPKVSDVVVPERKARNNHAPREALSSIDFCVIGVVTLVKVFVYTMTYHMAFSGRTKAFTVFAPFAIPTTEALESAQS